jgi:hypothetical protein
MKKSIFYFAFAALILTYSCQDDDIGVPVVPTPVVSQQDLLSQNTWKVSSVIANGSDIWGTFLVSDCYKDNEYFFRKDNRLVIYDQTSKCDMADPDSVVNNYELITGKNKIYMDVSLAGAFNIKDTTDIIVLNETTLTVDAEYSGIPAKLTFTKKP